MNWTKKETEGAIHYDHANGLRLSHYTFGNGFWTTTTKDTPRSSTPAMTALGTLGYTLYCRDTFTMTVLPTVDQLVEAIADLHAGGLP